MSTRSEVSNLRLSIPHPRLPPARRAAGEWQQLFTLAVVTSDVANIGLVVVAGTVFTGMSPAAALIGLSAGLALVAGLAGAGAWGPQVLQVGHQNLRHVCRAVLGAAATFSTIGLLFDTAGMRPWVFLAIPGAGVLCLASRFVIRK